MEATTTKAAQAAESLSAVGDPTADDPAKSTAPAGSNEGLIEEELLVEEVSIDGMCGVY